MKQDTKGTIAQHTPGPLTIEAGRYERLAIVGNGRTVAEVVDGDNAAESEANARLFASAPELIAEARHTLRNLDSMLRMLPLTADPIERQSLEAWAERNRAAIAKAEA